jgi:hypothetical protein
MWWLRIIARLGRIDPGDPLTSVNVQDVLDLIQQFLGG